VIVEDHVTPAAPTAATSTTAAQVFALSADTPSQLEAMAADLRDHLRDRTLDARDVAFTLQVGRPARAERLAIVAASTSELVADLDRFLLDGSGHRGRATAASAAAPDASASAEDLARAWVAGAAIAWHERDVDSSARRVALPTYRFASASHWLRAGGQSVATGPAPIAAATDVPAPAAPASPSPVAAPALRGALLDVLASTVADVAELPRDAIDPEVTLDRYGLTSALAIEIVRRLEALTGRLPRTLLFEHPTLNAIADVLIARHRGALEASLGIDRGAPGVPTASTPTAASTPTSAPTASTPTAAPTSRAPITAPGAAAIADIAIVGIAGRFPGADTIDAFWQNLREGRDAITAPPPDRADGAWFEGKPRWGGFLSDIAAFDPRLFQISPREAATMDPQERLFLETAWCALEDAGYSRGHLAEVQGTAGGGVFVGSMYQQYALLAGPDADVSSSFWSIANRVSHVFDLRGPSLAVDTACSSSLTAIHMACESLRRGECAVALAGGVNLHLHASKYDALERLGLLGSDARSRSLGDGDGYVPAEAVGAVVLRPLSDAVARGDRVYAVIKGSFLNHAGRTASFGVPSPTAEAALIATALARAGIDPGTIDYVEVAANGSPLGDAIEISGLRRAFADAPRSHGPCAIGSVKSSIGHPEAASGIAQLAKVVCQLQHRALVPTLHAEPLNPDIDLGDQLHVQRTLAAWPASTHPRRAAITSRGAGGASTHVIVEEFAAADPADQPVVAPGPCIVPLSASSLEQL
ncbi:MAG TPA: beta-ketoacyl synthase N-terminal-like domain-containing protein, partial [Kofleriaceae bacterium]|nr:beta-ketoacyl synthase N-terminal-like domain-containing protein [Kofleriaceae bacterium]